MNTQEKQKIIEEVLEEWIEKEDGLFSFHQTIKKAVERICLKALDKAEQHFENDHCSHCGAAEEYDGLPCICECHPRNKATKEFWIKQIFESDWLVFYRQILEHRGKCLKWNQTPLQFCLECFGGGLTKYTEVLKQKLKQKLGVEEK